MLTRLNFHHAIVYTLQFPNPAVLYKGQKERKVYQDKLKGWGEKNKRKSTEFRLRQQHLLYLFLLQTIFPFMTHVRALLNISLFSFLDSSTPSNHEFLGFWVFSACSLFYHVFVLQLNLSCIFCYNAGWEKALNFSFQSLAFQKPSFLPSCFRRSKFFLLLISFPLWSISSKSSLAKRMPVAQWLERSIAG